MDSKVDNNAVNREADALLKGRNNVQYLWFALLSECGAIRSGGNEDEGLNDSAEYARLFEKIFEQGKYRVDFDMSEVCRNAHMKIGTFTPQREFYYNHVKNCFIAHLISRGVIKSREEFLSGVLNMIFNISIGGSLEDLKAFESQIDFTAENEVMASVRGLSLGQLQS